MTTLFERTPRRADLVDEEEDPFYGSRPDVWRLTERERLAVLLSEAGVKFGERGLGALSGMCFRAAEELRDAAEDDISAFGHRFLHIGADS